MIPRELSSRMPQIAYPRAQVRRSRRRCADVRSGNPIRTPRSRRLRERVDAANRPVDDREADASPRNLGPLSLDQSRSGQFGQ
jgi:hypothetical protein